MALLELRGLSVRFGGHLAVSHVDFEADTGSITGLIGPNGAGKTTIFNLVCGVLAPSSGRIFFDGRPIEGRSTHARARLGIGRTFQRLEIFSSMTVRENVLVGAEIRQGWARGSTPAPQVLAPGAGAMTAAEETELILGRLGLLAVAEVRAGQLPTGQARLVELGRALAIRPRLVLLDEPASGLDESETATFGELLVQLATAGLGVLLVEHDIELVMRVCDRISVLDFGSIIAEGGPAEIRRNPAVVAAYLGGDAA